LRTFTSAWTDADYLSGCRLGALESLRHGTTTLVDIGNTGATCAAVADLPLRVYAGLEMLGLDPAAANDRLTQGLLRLQTTPAGPLLQKGLVPHSGYSLSLTLIHAGESREEEFLFAAGGGALHAFCRSIYAGATEHHGETPLGYLRENELLPSGTLVVHANGRSAQEIDYLTQLKATVVHCPQSHAFFGHPAFPAAAYCEAGIPLALGTDSLASGSSLSLWKAMRDFWQCHPDWTPEAILAMTTLNPGRALAGSPGNLGHLSVGALADIIGVRLEVLPGSHPIAELIHETQDIALVVVNGEPVLI
jgi:aminodeoxyfutalosine deaminase